MGNAKLFFRLIHSLCVYCSLRRTHTARYLLLLNQVRDPLTHIYIHTYMCVCTCVCNKYMKFRRGNSFRFISKRYTCSCICVSVSVSAACACNTVSVCVSLFDCMSFSRCASSEIKNGCSICKYKMLKIQKSFLKNCSIQ